MKNKIKELTTFTIIIIFFIYILNNNPYITKQVVYSIEIWITKIIPTLFPTFILVDLINNSNIPYYLNKYFKINYLYILSIISGSPSNAYIINKYNTNKTKLIAVTKYASLLFTITHLTKIFNKSIAITLIALNIISNLILIIITKPPKIEYKKEKQQPLSLLIINSIKNNINTIITILGTIIFINILPIEKIDNTYIKALLFSITEITTSLNYLTTINIATNIKLLITIISLSTCGLCIELQIKSIINDASTNYKQYIKYRLIHLIIFLILSIPILFHIQN